ncbi:MAG TPA: hypothetical protein VFV31_07185 [Chitinophagaceae bacterium]|nr:hypothetical protein [Chitinophagaceae bacterium]
MKKLLSYYLVFVLFVIVVPAKGQTDSAVSNTKSVQFKIGTYYVNNLHYFGRTDSLRSSAFFPLAEVWVKQRFYINAAPVFVYNSIAGAQYAGSVVTTGYYFRNTKWAGNSFISKPVYKNNSQLVQSALKWQVSSSFSRLSKLINVTMGADLKFSNQADYGAIVGVDHLFRRQISDNAILVINPTANMNMGTQNFFQIAEKQPGLIGAIGSQQQTSEQVSRFAVLSYELSSPVIFARGKMQLILIPAFVLPQNVITVSGRPDLSERGRNMFTLTAGAKIIL